MARLFGGAALRCPRGRGAPTLLSVGAGPFGIGFQAGTVSGVAGVGIRFTIAAAHRLVVGGAQYRWIFQLRINALGGRGGGWRATSGEEHRTERG